jgi:hypothetical protein
VPFRSSTHSCNRPAQTTFPPLRLEPDRQPRFGYFGCGSLRAPRFVLCVLLQAATEPVSAQQGAWSTPIQACTKRSSHIVKCWHQMGA